MGTLQRNEGWRDMEAFEQERLEFWDIGKHSTYYFNYQLPTYNVETLRVTELLTAMETL